MSHYREDSYGNIDKIAYSNLVRDSYLTVPVDQVYPFYKALTVYERLVNDSRCSIQHRLANGENNRLSVCYNHMGRMGPGGGSYRGVCDMREKLINAKKCVLFSISLTK